MKKNTIVDYKICKKLVLDTTYPGIKFDQNGISEQYWDYHKNVKNNWKVNKEGFNEFERIINKIKKNQAKKDFDCILGLSGGADSSYMLHVIVKNLT